MVLYHLPHLLQLQLLYSKSRTIPNTWEPYQTRGSHAKHGAPIPMCLVWFPRIWYGSNMHGMDPTCLVWLPCVCAAPVQPAPTKPPVELQRRAKQVSKHDINDQRLEATTRVRNQDRSVDRTIPKTIHLSGLEIQASTNDDTTHHSNRFHTDTSSATNTGAHATFSYSSK